MYRIEYFLERCYEVYDISERISAVVNPFKINSSHFFQKKTKARLKVIFKVLFSENPHFKNAVNSTISYPLVPKDNTNYIWNKSLGLMLICGNIQ